VVLNSWRARFIVDVDEKNHMCARDIPKTIVHKFRNCQIAKESLGFPSGVFRPQWLNTLCGYSCDLDWSIDNINDHDGTALNNIYTRMRENWEY